MRTFLDVCYNEETGQNLDLYLPEENQFDMVLYFHGGGLTGGDKQDPKAFISFLVSQGIAVASANYRLYPNAKYPDYLDDAADAVAWLLRNMAQYGELKGLYIGGSSAGGYISQMLCFDRTWLAKRGIEANAVSGYIHNAGQPTAHFAVLKERGLDPRRVIIDETAPLYYVGADDWYPPMLIIVSTNDIENRLEQTQLLMSTLRHFGHSERVQLQILDGSHCECVYAVEDSGDSVFGKIVKNFMSLR